LQADYIYLLKRQKGLEDIRTYVLNLTTLSADFAEKDWRDDAIRQ
jgi:hypothetical protein